MSAPSTECNASASTPVKGREDSFVSRILLRRLFYQRFFWLTTLGWSLAVSISLVWNLFDYSRGRQTVATQVARTLLEKDLLFRQWATFHGGVYVPVSEHTQPNLHLKMPERDITTPSGKALTLLNPAFMSRQVFEMQDQKMGIRGHITSLKPIRAENQPDPWERDALESFEKGRKEALGFVEVVGGRQIRLMQPLVTEQGCLRCHEGQGYRLGDIRGGISVTAPMSMFETPRRRRNLVLAHGGLWLLGCMGLFLSWVQISREKKARERLIRELQEALAEVHTLSGLVPICASCKQIRDDRGFWHQVEQYVSEHSQATFTHGICPDCAERYFFDKKEPANGS